ncbi:MULTISPECIES: hypothetical protein [Kitasatospora]
MTDPALPARAATHGADRGQGRTVASARVAARLGGLLEPDRPLGRDHHRR